MERIRMVIIVLATLVISFGAVLLLRPIVVRPSQNNPSVAIPAEARSTQYFEDNVDEARQVVAACRDGTIRSVECTHAETAIITVDSKQRFKRFRER